MMHDNKQAHERPESNLSRAELIDKLSELLAVERGGTKLYEVALQVVTDPEVLSRFG